MDIDWTPEMETGIKEVDDAHKILFLWVRKLQLAMKSGNGRKEALNILNFLELYASRHFKHEELCMDRYQCPAAENNKIAHQEFIEYFGGIKNEIQKENISVPQVIELENKLVDWLTKHILRIDIALKPCVHVAQHSDPQSDTSASSN